MDESISNMSNTNSDPDADATGRTVDQSTTLPLLNTSLHTMWTTVSDHDLAPTTAASPWYTSSYKTAMLTSFAVVVSLITVLANMTIIILAARDKKLRKMNSYLIINLACMDLIVGLFVMPGMSAYNILGYWPLGNFICDLWTCVDFMCCTASFFNLCVISWDRFGAVTRPLQHRSRTRGKWYIFGIIMLPWLASGLSWVPAIATWRVVLGYAGDGECIYLTDEYYVLISNIIVYVIPMFAILYLYVRVYVAVGSQMRNLMDTEFDHKTSLEVAEQGKMSSGLQNDGFEIEESMGTDMISVGLDSYESSGAMHGPQHMKDMTDKGQSIVDGEVKPNRTTTTGKEMERTRLRKYHLARMMTHKRTTKTLGIIVTVFLICWIPWTVLYPINGFCRCVPNWMYIFGYWAAYLNSTFNPFLYGFNRDFRKAFKRIFLDRCACQ